MSFPKNCPQLQDLPDLPPTEIAALPADMLAVLQHECEAALKQAKAVKSRLDGAFVLKYGAQAAEPTDQSDSEQDQAMRDDTPPDGPEANIVHFNPWRDFNDAAPQIDVFGDEPDAPA